MSPPFFHRLRLLLELEISSVDSTLRRLAAADYPTPAAINFIKELLEELRRQRSTISQIVAAQKVDPEGAFQRLQSEHRKLVLHLPYLTSLENAQTVRVPWSLISSFESMASALMPGRQLLTTCASDFNFSITWRIDRTPVAGLGVFDILELPGVHKANGFLHVLVGHELFHPLLEDFFAAEQAKVYTNLRAPCASFIKGQQSIGTLFDAKRLDEMVEGGVRIWRRAMEELMCDMGCAVLFGPAAILAMSTWLLSGNLDQQPNAPSFYPPHRFRLRTIYKQCLNRPEGQLAVKRLLEMLRSDAGQLFLMEAAKQLEEQLQIINDLTVKVSDLQRINGFPLLKMAYEEVDRVLDGAWAYVSERAHKSAIKTWDTADSSGDAFQETLSHLHSLQLSVPCGEIRSPGAVEGPPSNITAICLAAWLHELSCEKTQIDTAHASPLNDYATRCRLLLKSVEDSELKRQFKQRQSDQQPKP